MRAITRGRASLGGRLGSQSLPGCQWGRLNDTACSFAGQRRCLYKARHFPCCDGAVSRAGRTAHGTLLFTYGPYGMLRDAKRVLGLCATENFCSPQLRVCKNKSVPLLGFQTLISAPLRHFKGVQSAVPPHHDQIIAMTPLILFFLTKSLLCTCCSMQWGRESSPVLNVAGEDMSSPWFNISYKVLERHRLSGYGTECVAYCVFSHSAICSITAVQLRKSPFPPPLQSVRPGGQNPKYVQNHSKLSSLLGWRCTQWQADFGLAAPSQHGLPPGTYVLVARAVPRPKEPRSHSRSGSQASGSRYHLSADHLK